MGILKIIETIWRMTHMKAEDVARLRITWLYTLQCSLKQTENIELLKNSSYMVNEINC